MTDRDHQPIRNTEYTILVEGVLDPRWFDGMTVGHGSDGTTVVSGHFVDQAALHRVIRKIRDLGVTLVSIQRSEQ